MQDRWDLDGELTPLGLSLPVDFISMGDGKEALETGFIVLCTILETLQEALSIQLTKCGSVVCRMQCTSNGWVKHGLCTHFI